MDPLGEHFAAVVLELAPDGIAVTDETGRILHANGHFEHLFGYRREDLAGHHVEMLLPDRLRAIHREHRRSFEQRPQTRPMGSGLELWARHADGTAFQVEVALSAVTTGAGMRTIMAVRPLGARLEHERSRRDEEVRADQAGVIVALNDGVIQPLYSVGLGLCALLESVTPTQATQIGALVGDLNGAIQALHTIALESAPRGNAPTPPASALDDQVLRTGADPERTRGPVVVEYRIDADDHLIAVEGDWAQFARDNDAPELALPTRERTVWDFFADDEVRELWRLLVAQVRRGQVEAHVPYRCDSPSARRWFDMTISPDDSRGGVRFCSVLAFDEPRDAVTMLDLRTRRDMTAPVLRLCSWCGRAEDGATWTDIEIVVRDRHLLEQPTPPALSHGICPACREVMTAEIERTHTPT